MIVEINIWILFGWTLFCYIFGMIIEGIRQRCKRRYLSKKPSDKKGAGC